MPSRGGTARVAIAALAFAFTLAIRIDDISRHSWMLGDQIRDWSIALGSFRDLPLIGPPTHVGGYTIGPAFYWMLWAIRVTIGPWFQNLPHGGGIGQAVVQSFADALLLLAVWHRTRSVWIALTATVLIATASYDLCLSAIVWNPPMGTALAKIATALVLWGWPQRTVAGVGVTTAIAWSAVQCYTGAIFVAIGVILALLVEPLARRDRAALRRNAWTVALVIAAFQLPHALHQVAHRAQDSGMGAVTGSLVRVLTGRERPRFATSWAGYSGAFSFIQVSPWHAAWAGWALVACGAIAVVRYRRDLPLLAVIVLPQILAVAGYALYVGDFLDHYYYFSLMPAAVLTVLLAVTSLPWTPVVRCLGVAMLVAAVFMVPARLRFARTMHQMPEYGVLLDASRKIARLRQPMGAIRTEFPLPPTSSPEFLYTILGGHIDRSSPWVALVKKDGAVEYQRPGGL